MLVIEDRKVKTWRETNFFSVDSNKLKLPLDLKCPTIKFLTIASNIGLICPTIRIEEKEIYLKYDYMTRYIVFIISKNNLQYGFGVVGGKPTYGYIEDLRTQLKSLCTFVYGEMEKE